MHNGRKDQPWGGKDGKIGKKEERELKHQKNNSDS
jgi:hypothetical protein